MTINTERLKTDAAYWLESDPSDGEATHFEPIYAGLECAWVRVDRKGLRHYFYDGGWICADKTNDYIGPVDSMIPRPTKPAAPEWDGEGLPPVGCECEISCDGGITWLEASILYIGWLHCIYIGQSDNSVETHCKTQHTKFRPLRTKEQRQRDELLQIISNAYESFESRADAIIAAGWRKGDS